MEMMKKFAKDVYSVRTDILYNTLINNLSSSEYEDQYNMYVIKAKLKKKKNIAIDRNKNNNTHTDPINA